MAYHFPAYHYSTVGSQSNVVTCEKHISRGKEAHDTKAKINAMANLLHRLEQFPSGLVIFEIAIRIQTTLNTLDNLLILQI